MFCECKFYYIYEQIKRNGRTIELRINYCYDGNIRYRIVIELIGGIEQARTYILEALEAGKNVVTANKDLIAADGHILLDTAAKNKKDFLHEAAVAGGIPIIRPIKQCLAGNHISEVMGIVNGTTNFILS